MKLKSPSNPLPPTYLPTGSRSYRVRDGDSWSTLAKAIGVDALWLIQYNFETRDPAEVNWYLKHRVGCVKITANGRNFMFSLSDNPGIIYLPTEQLMKGFASVAFQSFGIVIEGDEDYQREVQTTLNWIARSETGMALLQAIRRTGKEIKISPWEGTVCNATASADSIRDATAAGYPVLKGGASFEQLTDSSTLRDLLGLPLEPIVGTGKGSSGIVRFSPTMFGYGASGACSTLAGAPGASPSQVLFHELAHAYRIAHGVFYTRPTTAGSVNYTNMEEFFAVVLSNVLTSDPTYQTGNRTLRADHAGFNALAPNLSTSKGFVDHVPNRNKMRELIASEPELTRELIRVKSYFNPFVEPL
jgi:hypothetical protein